MIDLDMVNQIANSQFAYLTMFILLLGYVLKSTDTREQKMREQLDKTVPILNQLVKDVSDIKNELKRRD